MSNVPADLKYTKDHEWLRAEADGTATIGITDHAQSSLGDITFVELPSVGDSIVKGDAFGAVESVKAASDLYAPVSGEVVAINEALENEPESVNSDSYGAGWMIRIKIDASEVADLLDADAYGKLL
ncbi:glycine cleavage system protein GcvH [Cerasicoccus arenae]|uniref:Glycine cleavage system H protein n=1 Tax=Cerasicoccus arenae TaxID=424488 RepID=A0A8J3GE48_9BACT|nr:glycine cleavage system protein GcvH [Cerasicoccus arenae]MBK1857839.1 glycine cleavage system protein GcvH [Cerasicoccus arenae]GHC11563.1 glycine cleavage system H protein [Cerasicoccus arenae]